MITVYFNYKEETIQCAIDFSSLSNDSFGGFIQSCQDELKAVACIMLCFAENEVKRILDEKLSGADPRAIECVNGLLLDTVRAINKEDLQEFREYGLAQEAVQSYSKYIS